MASFGWWKNRLNGWRKLSQSERQTFVLAVGLAGPVAISLRWRGLKATQRSIERLTPLARPKFATEEKIIALQTARLVERAVRPFGLKATCLSKSLLLWGLLRRQGLLSEVRLGVRRTAAGFEAHAWVEWNALVLNDRSDVRQRFKAFEGTGLPGVKA